jgi:hypothetical protein
MVKRWVLENFQSFSYTKSLEEVNTVSCSERRKELKRRRHRRKKLGLFKRKLVSATVSEKQHLSDKLRSMTPGAETIIGNLALDER